MKTTFLSTLLILISAFLQAQNRNKIYLRSESLKNYETKLKVIELPKQITVNWYDTSGNEYNEDKILLFVKDDTLYFDVPQNDTLVEAIAYNQIEFLRIISVGRILLIPIAAYSSVLFTQLAVGAVFIVGLGLSNSYSSSRDPYIVFAGLIVAAIDIPIFYLSKALWNGTRMTFKTKQWKLMKR